ncbi:MAG: glutaminase [Microbacterium sp.]
MVTTTDIAVMGATIAGDGVNPLTGERVVPPAVARDTLSVMASCGMYDRSGQWLFDVGMPAKSGVGGGIVAVAPGEYGIGVFSPPLDAVGNSARRCDAAHPVSGVRAAPVPPSRAPHLPRAGDRHRPGRHGRHPPARTARLRRGGTGRLPGRVRSGDHSGCRHPHRARCRVGDRGHSRRGHPAARRRRRAASSGAGHRPGRSRGRDRRGPTPRKCWCRARGNAARIGARPAIAARRAARS